MFDLRALRYFVAAYETGSITAAARRCSISQPSITAAIQNLEAELGARLFERTRQGLAPTRDAEILHPRASALLAEAAALHREFRVRAPRTLAIFIQPDVGLRRVAPVLRTAYELVPDLVARLVGERSAADIQVTAQGCHEADSDFLPLWTEPYAVLMPATHPLRFRSHIRLADLDGLPLIERPHCALQARFEGGLATAGFRPDIRATAADEEAVLVLVEMGVGLAIAPASHAEGASGVIVRPLAPELATDRTVGLAWRRGSGHEDFCRSLAAAAPAPAYERRQAG
ncbi:DNA-binding transcriptional LysR family regulator [Caulobacter ginsengisoli]|uniref:DNA-binding transcriptional LysR family regulator n=1 Tax=Caulobacter ginsengisoli TaxID=400775 RepID=A0ABU0IZG6_9CAUL|nr:LysR family transcriptional regulator [Caulobacter ginsengisoli]MDQ0466740.1 DNA-binding transcriptional LysR family regulator [Caulobacter ginsengisoli]